MPARYALESSRVRLRWWRGVGWERADRRCAGRRLRRRCRTQVGRQESPAAILQLTGAASSPNCTQARSFSIRESGTHQNKSNCIASHTSNLSTSYVTCMYVDRSRAHHVMLHGASKPASMQSTRMRLLPCGKPSAPSEESGDETRSTSRTTASR